MDITFLCYRKLKCLRNKEWTILLKVYFRIPDGERLQLVLHDFNSFPTHFTWKQKTNNSNSSLLNNIKIFFNNAMTNNSSLSIHRFTTSFPFRKLHVFSLEDAIIGVKQIRVVSARSRREVIAKLEIIKQCQRSFDLFQLVT